MDALPPTTLLSPLYLTLCAAGLVFLVIVLAWVEIVSEPDRRRRKVLMLFAALRVVWMATATVCWVGWNIGSGVFWLSGFIAISVASEIYRRQFFKKKNQTR